MAGADYYSCDACGRRTFYDAELNYHHILKNSKGTAKLEGVGDLVAICDDCFEAGYRIEIAKQVEDK